MNEKYSIGIDIGGSHISSAVVNLNDMNICKNTFVRKSVNSNETEYEILSQWVECINETNFHFGEKCSYIGISMPGPFDYELGISYMEELHKFGSLYKKNIKLFLANSLEISPNQIRFINDAKAFLKGELKTIFPLETFDSAIGLTLGTGLGSATYKDGIITDANYWCMDFKNGIAEDYISTRWFVKKVQEMTGYKFNDLKEIISSERTSEILETLFLEFTNNLTDLIIQINKEINSEILIIGGNISKANSFFQEKLEHNLNSMGLHVKIIISNKGEIAPIIGSASLWV